MKIGILAAAVAFAAVGAEAAPAEDIWDIGGSFGRVTGEATAVGRGWRIENDVYRVVTEVDFDAETGVSHRRTTFTNVSKKPITATCLLDLLQPEEGDIEVYVQASQWLHESKGVWQPLVSSVGVRNSFMRSCQGATPMLAINDRRTGRGRVFHLLTDAAYEMHAVRRNPCQDQTYFRIEAGMDTHQLNWVLAPGESVALPEIVYYDFTNRLDLDCHRLHSWWLKKYPGRKPVTAYNTWLCNFDNITVPMLLEQVKKAAELGLEYFVIDAGWFVPVGVSLWTVRGDWEEPAGGHLAGGMTEVADAVRAAGMKFGFWVEAEAVDSGTRFYKEHPEWVLPGYPGWNPPSGFYDFTNAEARKALVEKLTALLKRYHAEYVKFDFNQTLARDESGRAFGAYNAGYRQFLRELRERNPGVYLEGCASGGYMMDLGWSRDLDSFWLSDNQSPQAGLRIAKETMLRLPPRYIDRWITAGTVNKTHPDYNGGHQWLMATDDATWYNARSYAPEYIDAFAAGGPLGFSCNLAAFSSEHFNHFRELVKRHREDAEFWRTAVGRILSDGAGVTALQYSDARFDDVRVYVVAENPTQPTLRVYPALDPAADYELDGGKRSGAEIMRDGIAVRLASWNSRSLVLKKIVPAAAAAPITYVRQALFPGFDGKFCKMGPSVVTDGKGLAVMSYGMLLLSGSDVFYGSYVSRSTDDGVTWSEPRKVTELSDTHEHGLRVTHGLGPCYNRAGRRWFGLGLSATYENDKVPLNRVIDGRPYNWPIWGKFDPKTMTFSAPEKIDFPIPYSSCYSFGQMVELENGDMLLCFNYEPIELVEENRDAYLIRGRIVVARCRFVKDRFTIVELGRPIACDGLRRGVGEPSLVRLGKKFYMTVRSDEAGMWCESDDGLNYTAPKRWTWTDNGSEIGNRNTQQHWMKVGDKLYLAYTRVTPTNGHVFRNRAPVFLAEFDPKRGGLKRETETPVVPERGARLGNFCCTEDGRGGSWLITAEWMQPIGCEKYGSDNSLWLVKVPAKAPKTRGALLLNFDDSHFDSWDKALPIFDRYGAHATFHVNGELDERTLMKMRTYQSYGHSVALHGARHVRARGFVKEKGMSAYLQAEIEPQVEAVRKAGLTVRNFGYPCSDRDEEIDAALKPYFSRMRTGHDVGWVPGEKPLAECDAAFITKERLAESTVIAGAGFGSSYPKTGDDLVAAVERLARTGEALVLYSHDIRATPDGDSHNTSVDVLERVLAKAYELGVEVLGFDDIH